MMVCVDDSILRTWAEDAAFGLYDMQRLVFLACTRGGSL